MLVHATARGAGLGRILVDLSSPESSKLCVCVCVCDQLSHFLGRAYVCDQLCPFLGRGYQCGVWISGCIVWVPVSVDAAYGKGPWGSECGTKVYLSGPVGLQMTLECNWYSCGV